MSMCRIPDLQRLPEHRCPRLDAFRHMDDGFTGRVVVGEGQGEGPRFTDRQVVLDVDGRGTAGQEKKHRAYWYTRTQSMR